MRATNGTKTRNKQVCVTVGGLSREAVKVLREAAKENHRSLAGHIRALLEAALEKSAASK
jgi:hypothetical protein